MVLRCHGLQAGVVSLKLISGFSLIFIIGLKPRKYIIPVTPP